METTAPAQLQALLQDALARHREGRLAEAEALYRRVLAASPENFEALYLTGVASAQRSDHAGALALLNQARAINPGNAEAAYTRALVLKALNRLDAALADLDTAIALKPDYAPAHNDRGLVLKALGRAHEALASYDKAIALAPGNAGFLCNRGNTLIDLKRPEEALEAHRQAVSLKPDTPFLRGTAIHTALLICEWQNLTADIADIEARVARGEKAAPPFPLTVISSAPALLRKTADLWADEKYPASASLGVMRKRSSRDTIRIGYFSMDFREHPVAALAAGLIDHHDRGRFAVYGFSYGPASQDAMRRRLEGAFDKFFDVGDTSDADIAALARTCEIDIAVDLGGYTSGARTHIFALRAAPLQVNYLGYPGTMGAPYVDYIVADATVIPPDARAHYSEKVVHLPHTYQPNDRLRPVGEKTFTRAELGLPEAGFVFCCFNNTYKILPQTFDIWMRILRRVPGSVLWLFEDNPIAGANLRKEAAARGVDPARLITASRWPRSEHLARQRTADLFLDTQPYGAHTTASDALWVGLPVLTQAGGAFAGRVAASLLAAAGLPELIAATPGDYEDLAIDLAAHPEKLQSLKTKLACNRLTAPLFDTKLYARHLEQAFKQMIARADAGLDPDHIVVAP